MAKTEIPAVYQDIYQLCSQHNDSVNSQVFKALLNQTNLNRDVLDKICILIGFNTDFGVSKSNVFKALALVAWAQQGKTLKDDLYENYQGKEYPLPQLSDLNPVRNLKLTLQLNENPSNLGLSYMELTQMDTIGVELVPEKKGLLFMKHSEYFVKSKRFCSNVKRRYNDFLALYELLLNRFPYRIIPRLPPKRIVSTPNFLETRKRALNRWLTLICRHPIISNDQLVRYFLTDDDCNNVNGNDVQYKMRELFRRLPDEFMTSDLAATAKNLLPNNNTEFATNREQIRHLVQIISRVKKLLSADVKNIDENLTKNSHELSMELNALSALNVGSTNASMQKCLAVMSNNLINVSSCSQISTKLQEMSIIERISLLLDLLIGHCDLCERLEKGLTNDHQLALGKMLALKKRRLQGVLKGSDNESIQELETKMLAQEEIISNIELRSNFSLYCVHFETQLVFKYLETMEEIFACLIQLKLNFYTELTNIWREMKSTV